jgi:hypothetical protein
VKCLATLFRFGETYFQQYGWTGHLAFVRRKLLYPLNGTGVWGFGIAMAQHTSSIGINEKQANDTDRVGNGGS